MQHNLDIERAYTPEGLMEIITEQAQALTALTSQLNQIAENLHELGLAAEMGRFTKIENAAVRLATTLDKIDIQTATLMRAVEKATK